MDRCVVYRFLAYLAAAFQHGDVGILAPLLSALQSPLFPAIKEVLTATPTAIPYWIDTLILVEDDVHLLTPNRKQKCHPQLKPNRAN